MNRKEELVLLKNFYKSKGLKYEDLERELSYGKGTIRSSIARGGTDTLLISLQKLKIKLFPEETSKGNIANEVASTYGHKSFNSDYIELQGKLIDTQAELLRVKDENISLIVENKQLKERLQIVDKGNAERPTYVLPGENEKKAAS
jgi:hypothetical protein